MTARDPEVDDSCRSGTDRGRPVRSPPPPPPPNDRGGRAHVESRTRSGGCRDLTAGLGGVHVTTVWAPVAVTPQVHERLSVVLGGNLKQGTTHSSVEDDYVIWFG